MRSHSGSDSWLTPHPPLQLEEYLDVAAGVKEIHLHNAFTDVAFSEKADNAENDETATKIDYTNKTPPERTGGGW